MTHEPIHTVHLTPHITWQGTQAELEAMQAEGWPLISAGEIIAACKADTAEAETYVEELERNILAAARQLAGLHNLKRLARWLDLSDDELNNLPIGLIIDDHKKMQADVNAVLAALKGETDE